MKLVEFMSSKSCNEKIFVDPDEVSFIRRVRYDRDLGEYSQIVMKNGERVDVLGLPTKVAKVIRDAEAISN